MGSGPYFEEKKSMHTRGRKFRHGKWLQMGIKLNFILHLAHMIFTEDFLRATKGAGPSLLEEVVNWKAVVDKYLQLIGQSDGPGEGDLDEGDDDEGGTEAPAAAPVENA